jgi:hypothetical protein
VKNVDDCGKDIQHLCDTSFLSNDPRPEKEIPLPRRGVGREP